MGNDIREPKEGGKVQYHFSVFHKPNVSLLQRFLASTLFDDFETKFLLACY